MAWTKEQFVKEIEDSYPKPYPSAMKAAIFAAIESKKIRDLGKIWADLIKYESASKWWHSPPDWNAIKKYVKVWGKPPPKNVENDGKEKCKKCDTEINFQYGDTESYTCPKCGDNAVESFLAFQENKARGEAPKEGSAGEKIKNWSIS
jgi:hypothetical protein